MKLLDQMSQRMKAEAMLLVATVGWGLTFPVNKIALADASPGAYLAVRFLIGAVVAACFARGALKDLHSVKLGAFLGLFSWLGFALNTWGLKYTSATRSGFITNLCVVLVPLVGALVFRTRATLAAYAGAVIAAIGLYVLSAGDLGGGISLLGDMLTIGSALCYAFHILFTERFAKKVVVAAAVTSQLTVTAVLSALMIPFESARFVPTPSLLASLAFCGVFASALFIYLQLWAQARTTAVRAALIFALEPALAALFSNVMLGEPAGPSVWKGGALILAGILFAELWPRLQARREQAPEPTPAPGAEAQSVP